MSLMSPAAKLFPDETVQPSKNGFAHSGAVIVGPALDFGVELVDQGSLRQSLTAPDDPPKLR